MNVRNRESTYATAEFSPSAIDAMVIYQPKSVNGLEVGGHYGMGNKDVRDLSSYSGYMYYEPGPFRVKAEVIGLTLKRASGDVTSLGYYAFGGYQVTDNVELVGRFETYDPNTDVDEDGVNFITLGVVYKEFAGKVNHKLTTAIVLPSEQGTSVDNTTVYAMWQLVF
jgi:predicted porin